VTLPPLSRSALSLPVQRYLLVLMLFAIARASETFIVLLGHQLGIGIVALLLFWARHFAIDQVNSICTLVFISQQSDRQYWATVDEYFLWPIHGNKWRVLCLLD
jgi:hypothetical protein